MEFNLAFKGLRMIDSPVNCNVIWRTKYSNELYKVYD